MLCLVLWVACPLLLLLLLYFIWKTVADADLTLLWNEQFGLKPGEPLIVFYHCHNIIVIITVAPIIIVISHQYCNPS